MEQRRNARAVEREIPEKTRLPTPSSRRPGTKIRVEIPAADMEGKHTDAEKEMLLRRPWQPSETHKCYLLDVHFMNPVFYFALMMLVTALMRLPQVWGVNPLIAKNFQEIFDCKQADVSELLSQKIKTDAERKRKIMSAIVETLLFCGRQEVSLHGHRDSGRLTFEEPSNNDGNFRALLPLRVRAGYSLLNEHLNSERGNAMYISAKVKNEILSLIRKQIQETVVEIIKKSKFFTVLGDETIDISSVE
ncbi:hypothetical protein PR048_012521 [Dryococelus australis]|uniref:DUF4371 domain-containing protein n=1 Tax=Dryococelus australis TaxID=614101 RepID=A0ABQ9HPW2_9NEOP|nr:hypothetical protein PR048_012521 [Dryococelus australis]